MTRIRIVLEATLEHNTISGEELQDWGDVGKTLAEQASTMTSLPFKYTLGFGGQRAADLGPSISSEE